jgi:hypothetical protein
MTLLRCSYRPLTDLSETPTALQSLVVASVPIDANTAAVSVVVGDRVLVHLREGDIRVMRWPDIKSSTDSSADSVSDLPGHVFAQRLDAATAIGRALVTVGSDGAVTARLFGDNGDASEVMVGLAHRSALGVASAVSPCFVGVSSNGAHMVSAAGDGEIVLWAWDAAAKASDAPTSALVKAAAACANAAAPVPKSAPLSANGTTGEQSQAVAEVLADEAKGSTLSEADRKLRDALAAKVSVVPRWLGAVELMLWERSVAVSAHL